MRRQFWLGLLAAGLISTAVQAAPTVELNTNLGKITVELDAEKTPKSAANFLQYAKDGFYAQTIFHRVIPGFMIQGGGFTAGMDQKPTNPPIPNECRSGGRNQRGTLAMARTSDPHSATAQFFINLVDNPNLDCTSFWGYAVFGRVTAGMDVVDKIAKVPTGNRGMHQNVPLEPVVIQSVKIISDK
ncbi:MAG: hypothetical protein RIR00_1437 [Pseudomonadota bacterium]|jgi:cyclophilin family peptidyl-prolyl cis-trans isomerase